MSDQSKKLKRTIPILAVDGVQIEIRVGGKGRTSPIQTYPIPTADIFFTVTNDNDEEVVAAVRMNNEQITKFQVLLEEKIQEFRESY